MAGVGEALGFAGETSRRGTAGGRHRGDAAPVFSNGDTATRRWEALRDSRPAVHPMPVVVGSRSRQLTYSQMAPIAQMKTLKGRGSYDGERSTPRCKIIADPVSDYLRPLPSADPTAAFGFSLHRQVNSQRIPQNPRVGCPLKPVEGTGIMPSIGQEGAPDVMNTHLSKLRRVHPWRNKNSAAYPATHTTVDTAKNLGCHSSV